MGPPLESCCSHPLNASRVSLQRRAAVPDTWTHAVVPSMRYGSGGEQHSPEPGLGIHPWLHMCLLARFGKHERRSVKLSCSANHTNVFCLFVVWFPGRSRWSFVSLYFSCKAGKRTYYTNVYKKQRFYCNSAVKLNVFCQYFKTGWCESAGGSLGSAGEEVQVHDAKKAQHLSPYLSGHLHLFLLNQNSSTGIFWF